MELTYGPEKHGLICGFSFSPGQPGQAVGLDEAMARLRNPEAAPGFVWLHFNLSDASAERWMREQLDVVPEFFEALREGSRSTRIEDVRDSLVVVVNDVAYEFAFDPSQIETLWMLVTPHLALTVRLHPLRSIDRLRMAVKEGLGFSHSAEFVARLLGDQASVLVHIVRKATTQVDEIEDRLLAGRLQTRRGELGQLRRLLVRLQRLLAPEPGALFRLLRQPPPWLNPISQDVLRQATEEFTLVIRDMSELQERIKLLQEEIAARLAEQTGRSLFTLTMVTVLALPTNMVAGLFGMNVGGVPLAEHPKGFWIVVSVIAGLTGVLAWNAFRSRD
jgi:zinc transporter